jgi:hypothetical protein
MIIAEFLWGLAGGVVIGSVLTSLFFYTVCWWDEQRAVEKAIEQAEKRWQDVQARISQAPRRH